MVVIINKVIPFKGFKAMNFFGLLFARKELKDVDINHEAIHTAQMRELLYIFFYIIYGLEYIVRLFQHSFKNKPAYRAISFEKEAYENEKDLDYLKNRKHYAQWKKKSRA